MANLAQRIKNILRPFKRIRKEINAMQSEITKTIQFDNIAIAFEQFCHNQTTHCMGNSSDSIDFSNNHFVLFDYPYHHICNASNLGDHIQTIATKNALDSIYKSANYEYFGRDYLAYYNSTLSQNRGGGTPIANRKA